MTGLNPADIDAIVARTFDHWQPILGRDGARIVADSKRRRLEGRDDIDPDFDPTDAELGGLPAAWAQSRRTTTANPSLRDEWA